MKLKFLVAFLLMTLMGFSQKYYLFVGTYTSGPSKGIYVYEFDAATGKTKWVSNTDSAANPSFLAISPNGKHVYSVNEISRNQAGMVSAYSFDALTGKLKFINQQSSGRENPCHISINKDAQWLMVANYTGGSLACIPIRLDGSLVPMTQHILHAGKSVNLQRQEKPHVHSVFFSPDEKYLLTPDLGTDQVNIYKFSPNEQKPLMVAYQDVIKITPGNGPRHLDFSPDGKFLYIIEEMGGTVSVHKYANGQTQFVERIATHPTDFKEQPGSADIHVSADGKFLYASNRGKENNIAIFSINNTTGKLTPLGYESTKGQGPRNFSIDPTGKFLLVANQLSSTVEIFNRDAKTGLLKHTGNSLQIPNPVCLKFLKK